MQTASPVARFLSAIVAALIVASIGLIGAPASALAEAPMAEDTAALYLKASNKTLGARAYEARTRVMLTKINAVMAEHLGVPENGSLSLFNLEGSYSGEDSATWQRFDPLMNKDGAYPARGLQMASVGGRTYLHGPVPEYGAPDFRWYTGEELSYYLPTYDQRSLAEGLMGADLSSMAFVRSDSIDSQKCRTYASTDAALTGAAYEALYGQGSYDPTRVYSPSVGASICQDGYIHRITVTFDFDCSCKDDSEIEGRDDRIVPVSAGAAPQAAKLFVTYQVEAIYRSFEKVAPIEAPRGAAALVYAEEEEDLGVEAVVFNGGNIRSEPSLSGSVLGQLHAGQRVYLIERTADARWYHVVAPEAFGWVSASLLTLPADAAQSVPVVGEAPPDTAAPSAEPESLTATVYNGGNVRESPSTQGRVLDQINARELVTLRGRRGSWYEITNIRGVTGWVHQSLLTVDAAVAAKVPER